MKRRFGRCFACGKPLGANPWPADTHEDQLVSVGTVCIKLIRAAGDAGYQPPRGGPRLFVLTPERACYFGRCNHSHHPYLSKQFNNDK